MKKAFTMIELIFVIVIIGILSAVAIPKLSSTAERAYITKAGTVLASVRSSLSTQRQKRILRGLSDPITDLGEGSNAFSYFNGDTTDKKVLQYPVKNCIGESKACWSRSISGNTPTFIYRFPESGDAKFKLEGNTLVCDNDSADCAKLE